VKRLIGIIAVLAATLAVSIGLAPMARAGSGDSFGPGSFGDIPAPPIFLLNQAGPPVGCSAAFLLLLPPGTVACLFKYGNFDDSGLVEAPCQTSMVDQSSIGVDQSSIGLMTCTAGSSAEPAGSPYGQGSVSLPVIVASNGSFSLSCDGVGCQENCDAPVANHTPADTLAGQVCGILAEFQQIPVVEGHEFESEGLTVPPEWASQAQDVCNRLHALKDIINAQVQQQQISADAAALLLSGSAPGSDPTSRVWGGVTAWRGFHRLGGCQT
jgi:hypothetical protein